MRDHLGRRLHRRHEGSVGLEHEIGVARLLHGGDVGQVAPALLAGDREALDRPGLDLRMRGRQHARAQLHGAGDQRLERVAAAGEHDRRHLLQSLAQLQHLRLQLRRGADRRRRDIELVRILLRERDELLHRADGKIGLDREHVRRNRKLADRGEVLERIVGDRLVEAWIDGVSAGREQDGVAVRIGARRQAHADIAAAAAAVLDDERATHRVLQRRRHEARDDVGGAARRVGDDDPHRTVGIGGDRRTHAQHRGRQCPRCQRALDDATPRRPRPAWCSHGLPPVVNAFGGALLRDPRNSRRWLQLAAPQRGRRPHAGEADCSVSSHT